MRKVLVVTGFAMIVAYAAYGALLMNNWAVVAASGISLDETIMAMSAKGQDFSSLGGWVFTSIGIALAISWLVVALSARLRVPIAAIIGSWSLIIALGAPAFFFTSFANMNSVGDTFEQWNADAAFTLEVPLYVASLIALALFFATGCLMIWAAITRPGRPLPSDAF